MDGGMRDGEEEPAFVRRCSLYLGRVDRVCREVEKNREKRREERNL
jgi:hypothetical protein